MRFPLPETPTDCYHHFCSANTTNTVRGSRRCQQADPLKTEVKNPSHCLYNSISNALATPRPERIAMGGTSRGNMTTDSVFVAASLGGERCGEVVHRSQSCVQQLRTELKESNGTIRVDNWHREQSVPCSPNDLLPCHWDKPIHPSTYACKTAITDAA